MRAAQFFLGSIPVLIQLFAQKYRQDDLSNTIAELESENNVPMPKIYDFIIVGGGTAGCVLAGRLSEKFNILLLEAGGSPPPAVAVPFFAGIVYSAPTINYFFQPFATINGSRDNRESRPVVTGKMLGGSGSHNSMIHNRGNPFDFDHWSNLVNDSSWTYNNLLPYFKKSEHYIGDTYGQKSDVEFYGKNGPITVQMNKNLILDAWLQAGEELGYKTNDPNGFQTESFAPLNHAVKNGKRSSSYSEYVNPFENVRENLTVIRYANVSEILLDENNQAYGVAYSRHDVFPQIVHASKEVIISAGTFSSPLLLMKSGIGPVKILEAAEIPVRVPSEAVGTNLVEHAAVALQSFSVNDTSMYPHLLSNEIEKVFKEFREEEGLLASFWKGAQLFKVSKKSERKDWPDLYIKISPPVIVDNVELMANFSVVLGRPKSRGTISLDTEKYKKGIRDDTELALIDFNFLSHPDDIEALLEGVKFVFDIIENTRAFQRVNMTYTAEPISACYDYTFRSDNYWRCFIRHRTVSWTHMVGTCGMGPESGTPNNSVVDNIFRVRGVEGLRVVDASVMPSITNANTNAPVIMLAEKAAEEIKIFWSNV